jgi:hypothetical protein
MINNLLLCTSLYYYYKTFVVSLTCAFSNSTEYIRTFTIQINFTKAQDKYLATIGNRLPTPNAFELTRMMGQN